MEQPVIMCRSQHQWETRHASTPQWVMLRHASRRERQCAPLPPYPSVYQCPPTPCKFFLSTFLYLSLPPTPLSHSTLFIGGPSSHQHLKQTEMNSPRCWRMATEWGYKSHSFRSWNTYLFESFLAPKGHTGLNIIIFTFRTHNCFKASVLNFVLLNLFTAIDTKYAKFGK